MYNEDNPKEVFEHWVFVLWGLMDNTLTTFIIHNFNINIFTCLVKKF